MDIAKLGFRADAMATLSTETVTVPAGTFNCYKVTVEFRNPQLSVPENVQIIGLKSFSGELDVWVAPNVGVVKFVFRWEGSADFKQTDTGRTGTATFSHREVQELISYSIK
jgi:hypothetical protein